MVALQRKLATPQMIVQLPKFLDLAAEYIRTDYPLDHVQDMASFAMDLGSNSVVKCVLGPPYSWHPDSSTTNGVWTSRLDMNRVAALSKFLFGQDSRYRASAVKPAACAS